MGDCWTHRQTAELKQPLWRLTTGSMAAVLQGTRVLKSTMPMLHRLEMRRSSASAAALLMVEARPICTSQPCFAVALAGVSLSGR